MTGEIWIGQPDSFMDKLYPIIRFFNFTREKIYRELQGLVQEFWCKYLHTVH